MFTPVYVLTIVIGVPAIVVGAILVGKWFKRLGQPTSNPYYSPDLAAKAWADPVDKARFLSGDWGAVEGGLCEDEGCDHHGTPHVCLTTSGPVDWDKVIAAGEKLKEIQDRAKARDIARGNFSAPFGTGDGGFLQTRDYRPIPPNPSGLGVFVPAIPANVIFKREAGGCDFYFIGTDGTASLGQEFYDAWLPWAAMFPQGH